MSGKTFVIYTVITNSGRSPLSSNIVYLKKVLYLIGIDEKTGVQALERIEQITPMSKGGGTRHQFEYTRLHISYF